MGFFDRLADRIAAVDSVVSVGLDPDPDRTPCSRWEFNRRIIEATHEHAAAYKPNAAFYEDPEGWRALERTVECAHDHGVPVVVDAKRGDIGNTARQYARVLDDADAVTVNPYLGRDSLEPFLERAGGVFVLCRTSNPGGADLQDRGLASGERVYERVADLAAEWDDGEVGLVVGATAPDELRRVRERVPDLPFLVPGVGAQGGDAAAAVEAGLAGGVGLVNSSRGIIFAGEDSDDYFGAVGRAARDLAERLNEYR